jgi:protein-tyrosine-phosphatase
VPFICQAGTVKSPVARELFRRRAAERGVGVAVQSRGIAPEDHMTDKLLAAARADGIDPKSEPAQALTLEDLRAADIIIYFNRPAEASGFPEALDWTDVPSMNDDYPETRAMILERSEAILERLASTPCSPHA